MDIEVTITNKINHSLNLWKFDEACKYYQDLFEHSFKHLSDYIKLLADFGKLDEIYDLIYNNTSSIISEKKIGSTQVHPGVINYFSKFIREKLIPNRFSAIGADIKSNLLYLSQLDDKRELLNYIRTNSTSVLNNKSDAEFNMVVNFSINALIKSNILTLDIAIKIITAFSENPNINARRKRYVLASVVDYFLSQEEKSLFKLKEQFYNQIQNIAHQLHIYINEEGAKTLYGSLIKAILKYNNTLLTNHSVKPRVAVCISGMFRGNAPAIDTLKKNLINPLNADVFVHSWDNRQRWVGIGGAGLDNWIWRVFGNDVKQYCPSILKNFSDFKKYFPTSAEILEAPVTENFTIPCLHEIIEPTLSKLDNEQKFLDSLGVNIEAYSARGSYNQAKMFYGIYAATQLMRQYERENEFEYDYVIRARPDYPIVTEIAPDYLKNLQYNEIALNMGPGYGPTDAFYITTRSVHTKMADLWKSSLLAGRLSPYEDFPKYDSHALMFLQMLKNSIIPVKLPVKTDFLSASSNGTPPDGLHDALLYDLQHTAKELQDKEDAKKFIEFLLEISQ